MGADATCWAGHQRHRNKETFTMREVVQILGKREEMQMCVIWQEGRCAMLSGRLQLKDLRENQLFLLGASKQNPCARLFLVQ